MATENTENKGRKSSTVWENFTPEPGNKARCLVCKKLLTYYRTTFNLKRHFLAKHPSIPFSRGNNDATGMAAQDDLGTATLIKLEAEIDMNSMEASNSTSTKSRYWAGSIWNHFVKLSPVLKRCVHCNKVIASQSTSNMKRHVARVHPGVELESSPVGARYGSHGLSKTSLVWKHFRRAPGKKVIRKHPSEVNHHTKSAVRHSGPDSDEEPNGDVHVEGLNEGLTQSDGSQSSYEADVDPKQNDQMELDNDHFSTLQTTSDLNTTKDPLNAGANPFDGLEDETCGVRVKVSKHIASRQARRPAAGDGSGGAYGQFKQNRLFFTANDLHDANFQATVHATNVILQLQNLDDRQRIIAEKLMSDVIYHARMKNLTEKSMVLVNVGTFEDASGR